MPVKEWFRNYQPIQLYVILVLTVIFFILELACSHLTHSLTLLMNAYHMLCNILALTGCLITIKKSKEPMNTELLTKESSSEALELNACSDKKPKETKVSPARQNQENTLKNTFGWARIDVISMLICCVFLASLSFSVLVEALQTLIHINHLDEMHHPLSIIFIGCAGLLLNGLCYLLIGGYTFHQGSFLYVTEGGDVILNRVVISELVKQGGRRLSRTRTVPSSPNRQREGLVEICRDVLGCVLVIICAIIVFLTPAHIAKFVDPGIALLSATSLMCLSYPLMKESCLILLQTIPGYINIDLLKKELLQQYPDIINVHDFHVWQLTATKIISTVHIIFQNQTGYSQLMEEIKDFFLEKGITQVTIQPEFRTEEATENRECLMQCQELTCKSSHCCPIYEEKSKKEKKKMVANSLPDLRSIRVINSELSKTTENLASPKIDA